MALSTVPDAEGDERQIAIPDDLAVIEAAVERVGAVLVVVDPLMAFLSGEANSHRDQDVRRALAPLARLAERTGAAVVVVRHLNKTAGGNALYRGGGSIGIVGAARSGLLIAKHPEDDGRQVLASVKSNLAAPAPSLVFGLEPAENGAVRVSWKGESTLDASALLSAPTDPEERSVLQEAKDLLRDVLSEGLVPASEVKQEARSADISERTLKTAKRELGVVTRREGEAGKRGGGRWVWELPPAPACIKGAKSEGLHPKSGSDRTDAENPAYPSHKRLEGLRGQEDQGVEGAPAGCPLNGTLSAGTVAAETRRPKSGPALALETYLEKPTEERLQWLTKAVLRSVGWIRRTGNVTPNPLGKPSPIRPAILRTADVASASERETVAVPSPATRPSLLDERAAPEATKSAKTAQNDASGGGARCLAGPSKVTPETWCWSRPCCRTRRSGPPPRPPTSASPRFSGACETGTSASSSRSNAYGFTATP